MTLGAAHNYAARGWAVIPIRPGAKVPDTERGSHDASRDPEQIARWWRRTPDAGVGVVAGPSELVILDRDPRNGGTTTLKETIAEVGLLPPTVTAITGSGGGHAFYRAPAAELVGKAGPGLDVLTGWRYAIAAPSVHPCGEMYRWRTGRGPDDLDVAELPEQWVERLRRPAPASPMHPSMTRETDDPDRLLRRAAAYLAKMPPAISGQGGHNALFTATVAMVRGFGLPEHHALDLLRNDFNPRCDPSWSERELVHKVRQAATRSCLPSGYLLDGDRR